MGESRTLPGQQIKMRRLHPAPFECKAISAVLIAHDQQNVRSFQIVSPRFANGTASVVSGVSRGFDDRAPAFKILFEMARQISRRPDVGIELKLFNGSDQAWAARRS